MGGGRDEENARETILLMTQRTLLHENLRISTNIIQMKNIIQRNLHQRMRKFRNTLINQFACTSQW
jgi:hypothetical protein